MKRSLFKSQSDESDLTLKLKLLADESKKLWVSLI
mgnify:CR=1 FL=1